MGEELHVISILCLQFPEKNYEIKALESGSFMIRIHTYCFDLF